MQTIYMLVDAPVQQCIQMTDPVFCHLDAEAGFCDVLVSACSLRGSLCAIVSCSKTGLGLLGNIVPAI